MLNGRTALIVEEEFLIALDIQRMLENQNVAHTLFARSASEAEQLRSHWPELAVAIVEIRTHDPAVVELIEGLRAASVPVVLVTSDIALGRDVGPGLRDLAIVIKPIPEDGMAKAIRHALAPRS